MHPAKRRRTDNAVSSLTKPFRSPLHVDPNKQKPSSEKPNDDTIQASSITEPTKLYEQRKTKPVSSADALTIRFPTQNFIKPRSRVNLSSPTRASSSLTPNHDEEHTLLQKQHSALTLQLKDLSQSLDTATQALKITQSNQVDTLTNLINKWQAASRDAAEELFSTAKDRIDRMGGVDAWRERYMKPSDEGPLWNNDADGEEWTQEQREQFDMDREEAKAESEKYGLHAQQSTIDETDNDSFTMAMMLQQLNIDMEVIGYDMQAQRWVE